MKFTSYLLQKQSRYQTGPPNISEIAPVESCSLTGRVLLNTGEKLNNLDVNYFKISGKHSRVICRSRAVYLRPLGLMILVRIWCFLFRN